MTTRCWYHEVLQRTLANERARKAKAKIAKQSGKPEREREIETKRRRKAIKPFVVGSVLTVKIEVLDLFHQQIVNK